MRKSAIIELRFEQHVPPIPRLRWIGHVISFEAAFEDPQGRVVRIVRNLELLDERLLNLDFGPPFLVPVRGIRRFLCRQHIERLYAQAHREIARIARSKKVLFAIRIAGSDPRTDEHAVRQLIEALDQIPWGAHRDVWFSVSDGNGRSWTGFQPSRRQAFVTAQ